MKQNIISKVKACNLSKGGEGGCLGVVIWLAHPPFYSKIKIFWLGVATGGGG
jgi:hypothetical protein